MENINLGRVMSKGYSFQIEMTYLAFKNGLKIEEIPICFNERIRGSSKFSWKILWEAFWLTLKFRAPFLDIIKNLFPLFISAVCRGHRRYARK